MDCEDILDMINEGIEKLVDGNAEGWKILDKASKLIYICGPKKTKEFLDALNTAKRTKDLSPLLDLEL